MLKTGKIISVFSAPEFSSAPKAPIKTENFERANKQFGSVGKDAQHIRGRFAANHSTVLTNSKILYDRTSFQKNKHEADLKSDWTTEPRCSIRFQFCSSMLVIIT